jgi:hypothetical protein
MTSNAASTKHDTNIVTGLFEDKESAEAVYNSLRSRGYSDDEINVIMSDATRDKYFRTHPLGTKAAEGTALGGVLGGTLGAVVGGLAAVGSNFFLPGIGLVVWGPIAGALAGFGAGGAVGGLVGALVGWGIPEDRAKIYAEGIAGGGTVIGVKPRSVADADQFQDEWTNKYRGRDVYR